MTRNYNFTKYKYNGKVLIHFAQLLYNLTFNSMSFNHFNKIIGWSHQLTIMITLTTFSDLLRNNKTFNIGSSNMRSTCDLQSFTH